MKLEGDLYLPLYKGANLEGWGLYRIGDGTWGKKPMDLGGIDPNGRGVCLEVKRVEAVQMKRRIPWGRFDQHQIEWLQRFAGRPNSLALVALWEKRYNTMKLIRLRGTGEFESPVENLDWWQLRLVNKVYLGWPQIAVHNPDPAFDGCMLER